MADGVPAPNIPIPEEHRTLFYSINAYVKEYMSQPHYDNSHDYHHILRVVSNANKLLAAELKAKPGIKYDTTTVFLAALLHDVGDRKYAKPGEDVDNQIANVLRERGASEELAASVQAIAKHASYSNEAKRPETVVEVLAKYPELAIVQDADRLDAIGAVGIGRCFAYTGAKCSSQPMSDAVDHFEAKLFKLAGMMKTSTGKDMAEQRTRVLKDFAAQYTEEASLSFILQ